MGTFYAINGNMSRISHWPTSAELYVERAKQSLLDKPFPFVSRHIIYTQQLDGTYREELRCYDITHAKNPEEPQATPKHALISRQEFGRRFKVVKDGEDFDERIIEPGTYDLICLKELP